MWGSKTSYHCPDSSDGIRSIVISSQDSNECIVLPLLLTRHLRRPVSIDLLPDMSRQSWLFILIAAFAFYNLWIRMLMNGTLASMDSIKASQILPGGKPLRLEYTGIYVLDDSLATLVIFFDPLLDRSSPNGRLLMLDVLVTLHSAIMWITVESQRKHQKHWLLNL